MHIARSLPAAHQKPIVAGKGHDTRDFVADLRNSGITPHGARTIWVCLRSAIDGRILRHAGSARPSNARQRIGKVCGWIKQAGGLRPLKTWG